MALLSLAAYLAAASSLFLPKHSKIVAKAASFTAKNSAISHLKLLEADWQTFSTHHKHPTV